MQNSDERITMVCPLNGALCKGGRRADFPKDEMGVPHVCRWWQHLVGKDPQSDKSIDQWDCAVPWIPILLVETSQMVRQSTASIDKTANIIWGTLPNNLRNKIATEMPGVLNGGQASLPHNGEKPNA